MKNSKGIITIGAYAGTCRMKKTLVFPYHRLINAFLELCATDSVQSKDEMNSLASGKRALILFSAEECDCL